MTNVMKRLSAVLIALAMMIAMMPAFTAESFAAMSSDPYIQVSINGTSLSKKGQITMNADNDAKYQLGPQVFAYLQKYTDEATGAQPTSLRYMIADGYDLDAALKDVLKGVGIDAAVLDEATIAWTCNDGFVTTALDYSYVKAATDVVKLSELKDGNRYVEKLDGADAVKPIIAMNQIKPSSKDPLNTGYASYKEAKADLANWATIEGKSNEVGMVIGNNASLAPEQRLVEQNGNHVDKTNNWASKFYGKASVGVNIMLPKTLKLNDLTFTSSATKQLTPFDMSDAMMMAVYGQLTWTSSDESVAKVDEDGIVTPVKAGTCTVSFKTAKDKTSGTAKVTVKKSEFSPAKVTIKSAKASGKKLNVSWNKANKASYYQVSVATKKSATTYATKKTTKKSLTKSLKSGKTYYVKVRAVRTYNGETYTGAWSKVKTVRL